MNINNAWVFDTEIYPNLFVLVARKLDTKEYVKFALHETRDDYAELKKWLGTFPTLIGFNNLEFDSQLLEKIWRSTSRVNIIDLYNMVDELFSKRKEDRFFMIYSTWDLSFEHIDLFKINHYDNANKRTSLKWLEFTMRSDKMMDLPFPEGSTISASSISKVITYCTNDVNKTYDFFERCKEMITLRQDLCQTYKTHKLINYSDSSLGEFIMKEALIKAGISKKVLEGTIDRDVIHLDKCIFDYVSFSSEEFNSILQTFRSTVINLKDGFSIGQPSIVFKGVTYYYGIGGLHACTRPGTYIATDDEYIMTWDVKSYYPFLSIANGIFPEHIGKKFCSPYKDLYNQRSEHQTGTALNYALKIALNAVYGKSRSEFSAFFDPEYTAKITVNGQLLLTMLAEALSDHGDILICNTDGIEVRVPKSKLEIIRSICEEWQSLTGLILEEGQYSKMVIRDVNNYLAITTKGKVKRKGIFRTYYDFTEEDGKPHNYDENPSATIIPEALEQFYVNDIPIETTITECNSIFPFLYGLKGRKGFEYWLFTADEEGVVEIERRTERAIRFFVKKRGSNIYKFWTDNRKNNLQRVLKGKLVETAMNISKNGEIISTLRNKNKETSVITNYEPDRDFYINQCYKIIQEIETGQIENEEENE